MSEIRKDPASSTWIISAGDRGKRPSDFKGEEAPRRREKRSGCPFCQGTQEMKPEKDKLEAWPGVFDAEAGTWQTRVLANKYPALSPDVGLSQSIRDPVYHYLTGAGGHEVIVDSPNHDDALATMTPGQISTVLDTYQQRYRYWRTDRRMAYVLIYKNEGYEAGASLGHPHSQVMATPLIPRRILDELEETKSRYEEDKKCVFCQIVEAETRPGARFKVFENDFALAVCPFASRFPFETWILPKEHGSTLEAVPSPRLPSVAEVISEVFQRLEKVVGGVAYNLIVHAAPLRTSGLLYYHWHLEVLPRVTKPAGFEWGAGIYINTVAPEDAAQVLRTAR